MKSKERQYLPSFAELVDMLTIDQIKEVNLPIEKEAVRQEIDKLVNDIDLIIEDRGLGFYGRTIRIIIALAQMNLHIWNNKDRMTYALHNNDEQKYLEHLKLAHQLNGIRNQLKNMLMEEAGDKESAGRKTNFNTDGLEGWEISI